MALADEIFAGLKSDGAVEEVTVSRRDGSESFTAQSVLNENFDPGKLSAKGLNAAQKKVEGRITLFRLLQSELDAAGYTVANPIDQNDKITDGYGRKFRVLSAKLNRAGSWYVQAINSDRTTQRASR